MRRHDRSDTQGLALLTEMMNRQGLVLTGDPTRPVIPITDAARLEFQSGGMGSQPKQKAVRNTAELRVVDGLKSDPDVSFE